MDTLNENVEPCQNYIKKYHFNVRESEKEMRFIFTVDLASQQDQKGTNQSGNKKKQNIYIYISNK